MSDEFDGRTWYTQDELEDLRRKGRDNEYAQRMYLQDEAENLKAENERLREFIQRYRYRLAPKENQPLVDELLGTNSPID